MALSNFFGYVQPELQAQNDTTLVCILCVTVQHCIGLHSLLVLFFGLQPFLNCHSVLCLKKRRILKCSNHTFFKIVHFRRIGRKWTGKMVANNSFILSHTVAVNFKYLNIIMIYNTEYFS